MNKTVELVRLWGDFEEKHPEGSIQDFCRYVLVHERESDSGEMMGGLVPPRVDSTLLKLLGRITKLNVAYAGVALEGTGIRQIEEFGLLISIRYMNNPRKTEIIYGNIMELSSGTDMLNRLKKRGLVSEYADPQDKRSKRMKLTPAGEQTLVACARRMGQLAGMMLGDMAPEDKLLCIQLLKNVEIKFSALWQKHRGKEFDDIYNDVMKTDGATSDTDEAAQP